MFDAWMTELRSLDLSGSSRPALADWAAASGRLRAALDAFDSRLAVAIDELDDRGPSSSVVIRSSSRCSQREADRRARRAEGVAALPAVGAALASGHITAEHVDALLRAADATSPEEVADSDLLETARRRPADLLARDIREWLRHHERPERLDDKHARLHAARRCVVFDTAEGMTVLRAEFGPLAGAAVRAALTRATDRLFTLDGGRGEAAEVRTTEQRRADALTELLTDGSCHGATTSGRGLATPRRAPVRSQLLVIAHADGSVEIPSLGPLPPGALGSVACTSELFGLVFSTDGQPLWHGTGVRLADDNQWRTLIARDGGCVICDAHPSKCEAHHIVFAGPPTFGATDIDNLVLICAHHHHLIHDLGFRLEHRADGSWTLVGPDAPAGAP